MYNVWRFCGFPVYKSHWYFDKINHLTFRERPHTTEYLKKTH